MHRDGDTRIPIIELRGNLIVVVQIELSDSVVGRLKDDVTRRIEQSDARGLVIDVSGIEMMDSYISRAIRDIGIIARLMGVRTAISGLDPMIAMTLTEMGMVLEGVATKLNLEEALNYLERASAQELDLGPDLALIEDPIVGIDE